MSPSPERTELLRGLGESPKRIPVSFLYDARGSQLYQQITEMAEYYPYREELSLLRSQAASVARYIPRNAVLLELGCGDASKTCILLQAVARLHGSFEFVGVDVSQQFLDEACSNISAALAQVQLEPGHAGATGEVHSLCADYMEGLRKARRMFPSRTLVVLWLGSSVGNLEDREARAFFQRVLHICGPRSRLLLAADLWKSPCMLRLAYDDPSGVTAAFIKNGLRHALASLGCPAPEDDRQLAWEYEAVVDVRWRRVEMWLRCKERLEVYPGIIIMPNERVFMEISRKFTPGDIASLAQSSGYVVYDKWTTDLYGIQLLVPPEEAMRLCWQESDAFFSALPNWDAIPIEFRHPFAFYYGHLAAFAVLKTVALRAQRPLPLDVMYSRGIDPQLLDPSKCHDHPETPAEWPQQPVLREYVADARATILHCLCNASAAAPPSQEQSGVRAGLWGVLLALEHEWMHQETLAYMKAQDDIQAFLKDRQEDREQEQMEGGDATLHMVVPGAGMPGSVRKTASKGSVLGRPTIGSPAGSQLNGGGAKDLPGAKGSPTSTLCPVLPEPSLGIVELDEILTVEPSLDVLIPPGPVRLGVDVSFGAEEALPKPANGSMAGEEVEGASGGEPDAVHFVWDNEGPVQPARRVFHAMLVSSSPVTVADFHCFVTCMRGYSRPELWQADDWLFLQKYDRSCPATWALVPTENGGGEGEADYWVYTVDERKEGTEKDKISAAPSARMRPWREVQGRPVFVSLAEAEAFCKAVGGGVRVMKEEEWNRMVQYTREEEGEGEGQGREGDEDATKEVCNNGLVQKPRPWGTGGHPKPSHRECVHKEACLHVQLKAQCSKSSEPGCRGDKLLQDLQRSLRRGGWEWTSTEFEPFPGFKPMRDYPQYSADFFDGLHFVLKGSSPATHPAIARDSFRNYYQRQYPFVFAKFRCCKALLN